MGERYLFTVVRVADVMTTPGDYQAFLAGWTRKQSIANLDRLQVAGTLANWASNRMITKSVSVHQCKPVHQKWEECRPLKDGEVITSKIVK